MLVTIIITNDKNIKVIIASINVPKTFAKYFDVILNAYAPKAAGNKATDTAILSTLSTNRKG